MERTMPLILMLFFLAPFAIISIVEAQNNDTLIAETCRLTKNYNLCASTLYSDTQTHDAKDVRDLAIILVNHVSDLATKTRNDISKLLQDPSTDKTVKDLLNGCMDRYNNIIDKWIKDTLVHLNDKDFGSARDSFASLPTNIELCERSFENPVKSPISDDSKAVDDLSYLTYDIILYKYQHPPLFT